MMEKKQKNDFSDRLLLGLAIVVLAAGVLGFYVYENQFNVLWRALFLVVVAAISIVVAYQSSFGKRAMALVGESRNEVRRMVWPGRQEVIQMTFTVIIAVILVGIFLWLLDTLFLWLTGLVAGR